MKGKILLLFVVLAFSLLGCDYKDIDKRFFVLGIGVDKGEDHNYRVTCKLATPSGDPKVDKAESIQLTEEADTIAEAIELIAAGVDKELEFGHTKIIVLGKDIVKEDVRDLVDWFTRRRDIQQIAWVAVGDPSAERILNLQPGHEKFPANTLFSLFGREGTEVANVSSEFLFEFRRELYERGVDAVLPNIKIKNKNFSVKSLVIFNEGKQKIELSGEQAKRYNTLANEMDEFSVRVKAEDLDFVVLADELDTSYSLHIHQSGKAYIDYEIRFKGTVQESKNLLYRNKIHKYEKMTQESIRKNMEELLKNLQEEQVDPIGWGLRYRATHKGAEEPKIDEWKRIYPDIAFKINVKTDINSTGLIY